MTQDWLEEIDERMAQLSASQVEEHGRAFDCPICQVDVFPGDMVDHVSSIEHLENAQEFWGFNRVEI
jgi:hypothetical protein